MLADEGKRGTKGQARAFALAQPKNNNISSHAGEEIKEIGHCVFIIIAETLNAL